MSENQINHLQKLIKNHRRRLQVLEEKKALEGLEVSPKIQLEIEDIQDAIAKFSQLASESSDFFLQDGFWLRRSVHEAFLSIHWKISNSSSTLNPLASALSIKSGSFSNWLYDLANRTWSASFLVDGLFRIKKLLRYLA